VTRLLAVPLAVSLLATAAFAQEKAPNNPPEAKPAPVEMKKLSPGTATAKRTTSLTATVKDVDLGSRVLTLENAKQGEMTMTVAPSVKRLNEVRPGDTITVKYEQALMLTFNPKGVPGEKSTTAVTSGSSTELSGAKGKLVEATLKVGKVDQKTRLVTLQDAKKQTYTVKAGPDIDLTKVKAGQAYDAVYAERLAVSVKKGGAKK
jgi:Cu/Ag efflux protein CusF